MIDLQKKIIFIHPRKTGGTTIESAFGWHPRCYRNETKKEKDPKQTWFLKFKHASLTQHINTIESLGYKESDFFKFACIRNPWDLMVSWYFFDKKNKSCSAAVSYQEYIIARLHPGNNTLDFLPRFFYHRNLFKIDYVIRYERYKIDAEAVFDKYNVSWNENFHTTSRPKNTPYQEINTDVTKDLIYKSAKRFIEYFEYEF